MNARVPVALAGALLFFAALALVGCAQQRNTAVTMAPMAEELPNLPQVERTIPASVGVHGRRSVPVAPLLPPFPDPGPTPEERKILGEDVVGFQFLKYPNAVRPPLSRPVGRFQAGPAVGIWGFAGQVAGVGPRREASAGVFRPLGGAATAVDTFRAPIAGVYRPVGPAGQVGPMSKTRVETDRRASRVAGRNPRNQP